MSLDKGSLYRQVVRVNKRKISRLCDKRIVCENSEMHRYSKKENS